MRPERRNAQDIPQEGICVKDLIVSALSGHAVRVHGSGMEISREASFDEACASFSQLRHVSDRTKFHVWFCLGDGYSQMNRRQDGTKWPSYVKKHFGVKFYNELRTAAWVAEKWPKDQRDPSKSWSWHKNNAPEGYHRPKAQKPPVPLKILGKYIVDGVEVIHQVDDYGRQYVGKAVAE